MSGVQVISRKDLGDEARNPQRLDARRAGNTGSKVKSDLHGDMQRLTEMIGPHAGSVEQQE